MSPWNLLNLVEHDAWDMMQLLVWALHVPGWTFR